jgi:hypothetical protein
MNRRLLTIRQFSDLHPSFSESSLRWLIFNEKENGFNQVTRRVGRRVLIDENAFFAWVDSQGGHA